MAICLIKLTTMHGAWCHFCWGNGVIQVEDLKLRCDPHAMAEGQTMKGWKVEDVDVFLWNAMESTWYAKMIKLYRIKVHGKYYYYSLSCLKQFHRNSGCLWIAVWFGTFFCQWCLFFEASQEFKKFVEYGCNPIRCEKHGVNNLAENKEKETEMYWYIRLVKHSFQHHYISLDLFYDRHRRLGFYKDAYTL